MGWMTGKGSYLRSDIGMKKTFKILGLSICLVLLFKGWIYRGTVTYREIGERQTVVLEDSEVIADISKRRNQRPLSAEEIVEISGSVTNARLRFTTGKASSNPNTVTRVGEANCVGYAALFCSIVHHLARKQHDNHRFRVRHLVGKLYFMGMEVHQFSSDSFFRDHDFVEIKDVATGEMIFVDPVVSDYLGINTITKK